MVITSLALLEFLFGDVFGFFLGLTNSRCRSQAASYIYVENLGNYISEMTAQPEFRNSTGVIRDVQRIPNHAFEDVGPVVCDVVFGCISHGTSQTVRWLHHQQVAKGKLNRRSNCLDPAKECLMKVFKCIETYRIMRYLQALQPVSASWWSPFFSCRCVCLADVVKKNG